jgi:Mrp family chromosome partitioning ATPase
MKNTIVEIVEKLNEILYIEAIYQRDQLKSIIVTSSIHLEGRSITISNLAITYAQLGMRVLLMECDLRNPSIEKIFGINDNPGLTDILLGKCRWNNCLITVSDLLVGGFSVDDILSHPGLENLYLVSHGSYQINPSVILESKQMHSLMVELKNNFDIILIDTPPFLTSADAMILCRHVDGVIIVYRLGKTPKNQLHQCIERLESINMKILGLVMNDMAVDHLNKKIKKGGKKTSGSDYTIPG